MKFIDSVIQNNENRTPKTLEIKEYFPSFHAMKDRSELHLSKEIIKNGFSLVNVIHQSQKNEKCLQWCTQDNI